MNVAVAKEERDSTTFNIEAIRREFPILNEASEKNSVHFLDSGASAQKPDYVLKKWMKCIERVTLMCIGEPIR